MATRVSIPALRRIGETPLDNFGNNEKLGLALGSPQELAWIVVGAQEAQPPNVGVLAAVYGACVTKAVQTKSNILLAERYYCVAQQALESL